jgi:hypothetical protein
MECSFRRIQKESQGGRLRKRLETLALLEKRHSSPQTRQ